MLFTGEYEHSIDAKLRVAIPSDIRSRFDANQDTHVFYLVPGPNDALWLWPEATFELMASSTESSMIPAEEMMRFEQFMYSQATRIELDKAGRIRIPERTLEENGLQGAGGALVILGVKDHLELHDPAAWALQRQENRKQQQALMMQARQAMLNSQRSRRSEDNA